MGAILAQRGRAGRRERRTACRVLLVLASLAAVGIPCLFPPGRAAAQWIPSSGWTEPFNVSGSITSSNDPAIVADAYGYVHVFWSEDLGGEPVLAGQTPGRGTAVMYRRLGPEGWTEPVDIIYGGRLANVKQPSATVDRDGYLNLVWIEDDGLYYSYAPSWQAAQPQAWAEPIQVEIGTVADARVLELPALQGASTESGSTSGTSQPTAGELGETRLLVVYSVATGANQGLLAAILTDRWPKEYVSIWRGVGNMAAQNIAAAVDRKGRIHLAWDVIRPPDPAPFEVWYGASDASGALQFDNRLVTRTSSDDTSLQFASPWVVVRGENEVHLQWAQGSATYRWHQYSTDGGRTWVEPYQIWPDLISQTGSQAAGADSSDTLYWVDVFRYPSGAYLTHWTEHGWERPEMFYLKYLTAADSENENFNVHYIRMAISQGNQLHIVFLDMGRGEVWHMQKALPAPAIALRALPTGTPTRVPLGVSPPAATPVPEAALPLTPQAVSMSPPGVVSSTGDLFGPGTWVVVAGVPVLLILVVVVVVKFRLK